MRLAVPLLLLILLAAAQADTNPAVERCDRAADLLEEIMATPEHAIPSDLIQKASCVALIPGVKKVGFVFGGRFGKGVLICRNQDRETWTGPSAIRVEGGSVGFQIGASSTDVVLLLMNADAADELVSSKFTLGADAAVAGGPVGRSAQAQTDAQMHAKILSYSRSRGLFAGVSLEGATLRPDSDANELIYGEKVTHKQILTGEVAAPNSVGQLIQALTTHSSPNPDLIAAVEESPPKPRRETRGDLWNKGFLQINSEPSLAEVRLGGDFNGLTPRMKAVEPGEYQIVVQKNGFEDWTQVVTVKAGETVTVQADLAPILSASAP